MNYSEHQLPNQNQPQKKSKKTNTFLNTLLYLVIVLLVSIILASAIIVLSNDLFALTKPDKEVQVTIPENATTGEVAAILKDTGIIDHKYFFQLFVTFSTRQVKYNPGEYELNQSMDYREVLSAIRISPYSVVSLTIPEGYTIEQIKQTILDAGLSNEKELTKALTEGEFDCEYLPDDLGNEENRLEGYLFPDTYEFYMNDSAETIIGKMIDNFEDKVTSNSKRKAIVDVCADNDMSLEEVITIASMIQKEAATNDEMKRISGVIYNRLNNTTEFPYLNIDATIQYVCGHSGALTKEDLQIDSPYNTYTNKGLPPGPICNPGYAAIYAAAHPEDHDYYYYVANSDGTGHIFSETLDEHNSAVAQEQNND
jgi:UPF0755 protein